MKKSGFLGFAANRKNPVQPKKHAPSPQLEQHLVAQIYEDLEKKIIRLNQQIDSQKQINKKIEKEVENMRLKIKQAEQDKKLLDKSLEIGKSLTKRDGRKGEIVKQFEASMMQIKQEIELQESQHKAQVEGLQAKIVELTKEEEELYSKIEDINKETRIIEGRTSELSKQIKAIEQRAMKAEIPETKFGTREEAEEYLRVLSNEISKEQAIAQKLEKEIQNQLKNKQTVIEELNFRKQSQLKKLFSKLEKFVQSANTLDSEKATQLWKKTFGLAIPTQPIPSVEQALDEAYSKYIENIQREALPGQSLKQITVNQLPKISIQKAMSKAEIEEQIKSKTATLIQLDQAIEGQGRQAQRYTALVEDLQRKNEEMKKKVDQMIK